MLQRTILCAGIFAALILTSGVYGVNFSDNFDTPHDYYWDGVAGTGWDGVVGLGAGETANAIDASYNRTGQLYLESTNSLWAEGWDPLGPFLYKNVSGSFTTAP